MKFTRCSYCGSESQRSLEWIRSHRRFQCAGCGEEFSLNNNNNNRVRKAFDRFRRKLTNMVGRM